MLGKVDEAFEAAGADKRQFGEDYKKYLYDTIDTFWGSYGADKAGIVGQTVLPLLTTLANSTYLTRVTISSLGDLIQPFQNSGFGAASCKILASCGINIYGIHLDRKASMDSVNKLIKVFVIKVLPVPTSPHI